MKAREKRKKPVVLPQHSFHEALDGRTITLIFGEKGYHECIKGWDKIPAEKLNKRFSVTKTQARIMYECSITGDWRGTVLSA